MKRIDLTNLLSSSTNIAMFAEKLVTQTRGLGLNGHAELPPDRTIGTFVTSLGYVSDTAKWLELPATAAACDRCYELIRNWRRGDRILINRERGEQLSGNCYQITTSLGDELGRHHTYVVAPAEGTLIDDDIGMFGLEVVRLFPDTCADISAGAKCRAYELWTACVMHMMRVAEIGVGALADHLSVKRGTTWGGTIANINEALKDVARIKGDAQLRAWASETGTYLNFVKDAFRNPAMHPERTFSAEEARMVFDNTRAFMRILTQRLTP